MGRKGQNFLFHIRLMKGGEGSVPILSCHCLSVGQTEEQGTQAGDAGAASEAEPKSELLTVVI